MQVTHWYCESQYNHNNQMTDLKLQAPSSHAGAELKQVHSFATASSFSGLVDG
jgi:hypothetical protein